MDNYQRALSNVHLLLTERSIVLKMVSDDRMMDECGNLGRRNEIDKSVSCLDHGGLRLLLRERKLEDMRWFEVAIGTPDSKADNSCTDDVLIMYFMGAQCEPSGYWTCHYRPTAKARQLAERIDPAIPNDQADGNNEIPYVKGYAHTYETGPDNKRLLGFVERMLAMLDQARAGEATRCA